MIDTVKRFNRYELKYVLPAAKCAAIIDDLGDFTVPDAHGDSGAYSLVSLYYDSPGRDCYWAKVEGLKFRRKVRVRIYAEADIERTERAMVEIKQRINRTVQKKRLELPIELAEQLCTGTIELPDLSAEDQEVASEVRYLVHALHLQPAAITAYRRRAFVGNHYDSGLRITFDTKLAGRVHDLRVASPAHNHLIASPELAVMEVKCNDAIPDWVTSLLARHDCQLQRVSKYCAVISKLAGLPAQTPLLLGS